MNKFESEIKKFRELLQIGLSAIKDAGRIYANALDKDICAKKAFAEAVPEIPYTVWATLEKIGRGQLHEKLLLGGGHAQQVLRTLSLTDQTLAIEHGVSLLLHDGTIMTVMPESMTASQISQVFSNGIIRDINGQRAWMESQKDYRIPRRVVTNTHYTIEGKLLVILSPMTFSTMELKKILVQLENIK